MSDRLRKTVEIGSIDRIHLELVSSSGQSPEMTGFTWKRPHHLVSAEFLDPTTGSRLILQDETELVFEPGEGATDNEPLRRHFDLIGTPPDIL